MNKLKESGPEDLRAPAVSEVKNDTPVIEQTRTKTSDSLRMVTTGLPSHAEVNERILKVSQPVCFPGLNSEDVTLSFPAATLPELSTEEYHTFQCEFVKELEGLKLRLFRLKLRALSIYMRGMEKGRKNSAYTDNVGRKSRYMSHDYYFDETPLSERAELIPNLNRFLPANYHLENNAQITHYDAGLVYSLYYSMVKGDKLEQGRRDNIENLLKRLADLENELAIVHTQGDLFGNAVTGSVNETVARGVWEKYRVLLKEIAGHEEADSWYSPTYGSSAGQQRGWTQDSSAFITDYQRMEMPEAGKLESELHSTLFHKKGLMTAENSLVVNGGMNALAVILDFVDRYATRKVLPEAEIRPPIERPIFKSADIYYEVDNVLKRRYAGPGSSELVEFDPRDIEELMRRVKKELPKAVFLNPMSNMYEMKMTAVTRLLEALGDRQWRREAAERLMKDHGYIHTINIVIDNSTLGIHSRWSDFNFASLPPFVQVIGFESMQKFAQDGQEITQAGFVTAVGEDVGGFLRSVRMEKGLMPPENTIRKLAMAVPRDTLTKKMERHSRNTLWMARELESEAASGDSIIAEVVLPHLPSHPDHAVTVAESNGAGAIFNIGFDFDFFQNDQQMPNSFYSPQQAICKAFMRMTLKVCKENDILIHEGSSYGFNTTRLAIYSKFDKDPHGLEPSSQYMRVSVGTENIKDLKLITNAIRRTGRLFGKARDQGLIFTLVERILHGKSFEKVQFGAA